MFAPHRIGSYRVLVAVGHGGMADVYLATREGIHGFNKLIVLKLLKPGLRADPEFVTMFFDEARLAARLSHPNVVQTYEIERSDQGYFIAMEYLDGQPLARAIRRFRTEGGMPRAAGIRVVAEMLAGLHYAHELHDYDAAPLEIVHRDVSPHNVFITYEGETKLMDFGIAKARDSSLETRLGVLKGKVNYMAPEQARSEPLARTVDVYGAGAILWEVVTGRRLWAGHAELAVLKRLAAGDLPETDPQEMPSELQRILALALAPDPQQRYPTAADFRGELERYLEDLPWAPDRRSLGQLLARAFEVDRSRLNRLVQEQLADASLPPAPLERVLGISALVAAPASDSFSGSTVQSAPSQSLLILSQRPSSEPAHSSRPGPDAPTALLPGPAAKRPGRTWQPFALGGAALVVALFVWQRVLPPSKASSERPRAPSSGGEGRRAPALAGSVSGRDCRRPNKPLAEISGDIEADATLHCDESYLLKFTTFVKRGVTLTIEKGTTIFGDTATKGTLVVQPGGRLVAAGTPDEPVVFTSENSAAGTAAPGDWGGIIVLGQAPTNLRGSDGGPARGRIEGITSGGEYGGSLSGDDSGVLSYVRIEYSGTEIAPNNEINGLTLGGVGTRTRLDHVQVRHTSDDCFEFFGGSVNGKYLVCDEAGDDGFDWDLGYRGKLQFLVMRSRAAAEGESNGLEGDNDANASQNEPVSEPTLFNLTLCGPGRGGRKPNYGMLLRRATRAHVHDALVSGFDAGLDVRDRTLPDLRGNAFFDNLGHDLAFEELPNGDGPFANDDDGFDELARFSASELANARKNPGFSGCAPGASLKPRAALVAGALTPPDDGFFDARARYLGAFRDAQDDWDRGSWLVW